jgi:D-alanyl-lipoteichoic acid acyltransferase DltB (MBOAT superfamily)
LLLPQIARPRKITRQQIMEGLWLIAWGYFQKVFVADNLAQLVNTVFDPGASPTGVDALVGIYAFAFQAYGDFAGYSNIARGVSKLMGIELNVNFLFPYLAISPREFWRNWHISLSTWLRDYLYIPLGGSRGSRFKTYRNLIITFVLGGLWHGAAWHFVAWGFYQGTTLIVDHAIGDVGQRFGIKLPGGLNWQRLLLWACMFQVMALGMLMIRVASVHQIFSLTGLVFTNFHLAPNTVPSLIVPFLYAVVPLMIVHLYQARKGSELAVFDLKMPVRYALYGAVVFLILLFGDFQGAQFIYFQF